MSWNKIWGEKDHFLQEFQIIKDYYDLNMLENYPRGLILEAGCGPGHIVKYLNDLGKHCIGLDNSETALRTAITHDNMASFVSGDLLALPFKENTFDTIICLGVIEHLKTPDKALRELCGILKRGGLLYLTVPKLIHWWTISRLYQRLRGTWKIGREKSFLNIQLRWLLKKGGFIPIEKIRRAGLATFMFGYICKLIK
jgi:SAM-dependent methyltransferase